MTLFRRLFHPEHGPDAWAQLAHELGGEYTGSDDWLHHRITLHRDHWSFVLDVHSYPGWKMAEHYTRLRAAYVSPDGFRFELWPRELLPSIPPPDQLRRSPSGYPELDARFHFRTADPAKLHELFSDLPLRQRLLEFPRIHLQLLPQDDGPFAPEFPQGVGELCLEVPGYVGELDGLRRVCELMAEMLRALCRIGSAAPIDPHVTL